MQELKVREKGTRARGGASGRMWRKAVAVVERQSELNVNLPAAKRRYRLFDGFGVPLAPKLTLCRSLRAVRLTFSPWEIDVLSGGAQDISSGLYHWPRVQFSSNKITDIFI